ncbi:unnamed protein product, partial [Mesorhabditis spiculigera]
MKRIIHSSKVPAISAPLSQATATENLIFVSGQLGRDETGKLPDCIEKQTEWCLKHMESILSEAGATMADVLKTTVLLSNITDTPAMNRAYAKFFQRDPPARAAYQVAKLPMGALVEIEAVAVLPKKGKL